MTPDQQVPLNNLDRVEEELLVDRLAGAVDAVEAPNLRQDDLRDIVRLVLRLADLRPTTAHYRRVRDFMLKLQEGRNRFRAENGMPSVPQLPTVPTDPGPALRILRARLIMEEAMETVAALGVSLSINEEAGGWKQSLNFSDIGFSDKRTFDPVGVADGCADISVVTIGTLIECGMKDASILRLVDENNAAKNGPGSKFVNDKLQKPPGHKPPDIAAEIARQKAPTP